MKYIFLLKHLDYSADICLLYRRAMDRNQLVLNLKKSGRLKINSKRTKILHLTGHQSLPECIYGWNIEDIDHFLYYDSVVSGDGGTKVALTVLDLPSPIYLKSRNATILPLASR